MIGTADYPARCRIVVTDASGNDQRGLPWGVRSQHYDAAATARLAYEAEALTVLDTAAVAAVTGASGGNAVQHSNLSTAWTPVLSTQIAGVGHMTHVGGYQVWARVRTTSATPPRLRLAWDVGDMLGSVANAPAQAPDDAQWFLVNLGEVQLARAEQGTHRWVGHVQAQGATGGENVQIDRLCLIPVDESAGRLVATATSGTPATGYVARDEFNQAAGALTGKALPVGGTWAGAGDLDDFAVETTGKTAQRTATGDGSVNAGRFALAGLTSHQQIVVQAKVATSVLGKVGSGETLRCGVLARYVDASNWLMLVRQFDSETPNDLVVLIKSVAGVVSTLTAPSLGGKTVSAGFLRLEVDRAGQCRAYHWLQGTNPGAPLMTLLDADLATGGVLASGRVGLYDVRLTAVAATRNYDNFAAWVPDIDAALFASQSAELATTGMVREDPSGAAYGPVANVIGDLPRLPPSGLENRPVELLVKASQGDLASLPDSAIDDLNVQVHYRPTYLFVPGA